MPPRYLKRHCKAKACIDMPGSLKEAGGDPRSRDTKDPRSHAVEYLYGEDTPWRSPETCDQAAQGKCCESAP